MTFRRLLVSLTIVFFTAGIVHAGVENYVSDLNIFASKKFGDYKTELSARYGISGSRFDLMLKKVDSPGDLAVALWLGTKTYQPVDEVVKKFRLHRGKGWGVVAREMGIKPGSPAFHQLKKGDLGWYPKDFEEVMKKHKKQKAIERKEKKKKKKGY